MLTAQDHIFLEIWKNRSFELWNEMDIREDFIGPLLRHLGYAKDTVNNIYREHNLSLSATYHRIGRKQIAIDYVPTLRLKKFWIIEAKPGTARQMAFGDLLQAHFYSIHPEVQAPYIVLTNGWEIRVYDALNCASWEDTILICSQNNCDSSFERLKEFLSAKTMLASIRRHVLSSIDETLKVEIDERVLSELGTELNSIIRKARPVIRKNAQNLERKFWLETEAKREQEMRDSEFKHLLIMMDISTNGVPVYGREIVRRFLDASADERQCYVEKLAQTYRGRPHSIFRVHCVDVFSRLLIEGVEVNKSVYVKSVVGCLDELVAANMDYYMHNDLSNALVHLDNASLRLAKKFAMRFMLKPLGRIVNDMRLSLSAEDLIVNKPTVAGEMIPIIGIMAEKFWRQYARAASADEVWKGIWDLETMEDILEKIPPSQYPKGDGDLLFFEHYGRGFDVLRLGTWDILKRLSSVLKNRQVSPTIAAVLSMTRDEVIKGIPLGRTPPEKVQGFPDSSKQALAEALKRIAEEFDLGMLTNHAKPRDVAAKKGGIE